MTTEAIVRREETAIQQIDTGELLGQIVHAMKSGVTVVDAASAVKELVLLANQQQDRNAKRQWMSAFARVRARMKTINAVKGIPAKLKDKQLVADIKWFYAPLEDLQDAVEPILEMEDLTMRFDSRREGNICIGLCYIGHAGGHEEKAECAVNVANAEGGDLGAMKKAKRGAMTAILGIKTRHLDDDAAIQGDYISQDQADALQRRAEALGHEMSERFTRYVQKTGADDYSRIRQGKYASMDEALTKAEKKIFAAGTKVDAATIDRFYAQYPTGASPQPTGAVSGSKADPPATAAAPVPEQASRAEAGEGPPLAGPSPKAAKCPNPKCKATLAPGGVCPNCGPKGAGSGNPTAVPNNAVASPAPDSQSGPYDHWLAMTPEEVKIAWIASNPKTINAQWKLFPKNVKDRINSILKG